MKKLLLLLNFLVLYLPKLFCQSDCNHPTQITICPSVTLVHETNAGMGDNGPAGCNIIGEDVLYKIYAPNGAAQLYVAIANASGPLSLFLETAACGTGPCNSQAVLAGNSKVTFTVSYATYYYLWVDAATTITYDISFGADTGTAYINIPNTQGNLQFDSSGCSSPSFKTSKPFFQVSYNNVYKTDPMTLSPLNVIGSMCITTFFKNTTGIEGIKEFQFTFNPLAYLNVFTQPTIPGKYNAGNWIATKNGSTWTLVFVDSAGTGKGDFTGSPDSCLKYDFCFTLDPISNSTQLTNVDIKILSDGFGSGFSGYISKGCCPPLFSCLSGSYYGNANTTSFGFSFDDPGNGLPIELTSFNARGIKDKVYLTWTTESETNNDYFTIEKSQDGDHWIVATKIKGAGNSTTIKSYGYVDDKPFFGISFYRLKQTDFDLAFSYSTILSVTINPPFSISINPNPASNHFTIIVENYQQKVGVTILDVAGQIVYFVLALPAPTINVSTANLMQGLYFARIESPDFIETKKLLVVK